MNFAHWQDFWRVLRKLNFYLCEFLCMFNCMFVYLYSFPVNSELLILIFCIFLGDRLVKIIVEVFILHKTEIIQSSIQSLTGSICLWSLIIVYLWEVYVVKNSIFSVNSAVFLSGCWGMSLMKVEKRLIPWEIPAWIEWDVDRWPLSLIWTVLFEVNDFIKFISWFGTSIVEFLKIKPSCQTSSNAFLTSIKTATVLCLRLRLFAISSITLANWVVVEC